MFVLGSRAMLGWLTDEHWLGRRISRPLEARVGLLSCFFVSFAAVFARFSFILSG